MRSVLQRAESDFFENSDIAPCDWFDGELQCGRPPLLAEEPAEDDAEPEDALELEPDEEDPPPE